MKLYMKQKVFSLKERFYVKDEMGLDKYYVEGEVFSLAKKLHVYNMIGEEVLYIEQKAWKLQPTYEIYVNGTLITSIIREFSLFDAKYRVDGLDWFVKGKFWAHDYAVYHGNTVVSTISKEWYSWGDSYMMDICEGINELYVLAIVLTIDCVMASDANVSVIGSKD